ncbi:DinB family protein [Pararhodonellum marinum]|uniref:DinB family protein n=1 Tax=Pararhodonellum marinum TaxID=2755358 RepID=UPI00188FF473|nr:DinB family protein [Pararhodonellum marinum]
MLTAILTSLFERELEKLKTEIAAYPSEEGLWTVSGDIKNPGGNLCLHLLGNLNAYIGAEIGKTGYVRNRDGEFSKKNVPRSLLLLEIDQTKEMVSTILKKLSEADLEKPFPIEVLGYPMTNAYFLTHILSHFSYHLGQINYHRRLLEKQIN